MTGTKERPQAAVGAAEGAVEHYTHAEISPDTGGGQALAFLKRHAGDWRPEWFVQLCTFDPINAAMAVAVTEIDRLLPFIETYQGQNLYFAVNPLWRDPGKKCGKADMAALACVHVDMDPPKIKLNAEQQTAFKQGAQKAMEALSVPPSTLIDTGNGMAGFNPLRQPVEHDRSDNADALEVTNRRLAQALGGDMGATDISRVMRLPFTTNYPTKTKQALERPVSPTRLLYQTEAACSLADFDFLPAVVPKATATELDLDTSGIDETSLALRFGLHQQHYPDLKLLMEGKAPLWSKDREGSGLDHAFAKICCILEYSPAEALLLLANYPHGKKSRERDEKYLQRTVHNAYAQKDPAASTVPESGRDPFYIPSFAERRRSRKPNRWLVENRFKRGSVNIIFGASGACKSTTMAGLAVSLLKRSHWHDSLIENAEDKGCVLIIAAEDDDGVADMVEAACIEYGIPDPDSVMVYITEGGYDLSSPEVIAGIKKTIATMPGPLQAIVIDTLNRNCGELDENSSSEMRTFLNRVDELREGVTAFIIHHNGHTATKRERGAYALRCNADSSVLCVREDLLMTMTWEKMRSAAEPEPLHLKQKIIVIRQERNSAHELKDVTAVCMVMATEDHRTARQDAWFRDHPQFDTGGRRRYLHTLLLKVCSNPGTSQADLAVLCDVTSKTIGAVLDLLVAAGLVEGKGKGKTLKLTKTGLAALNEIVADTAVNFRANGHDVQLLPRVVPALGRGLI